MKEIILQKSNFRCRENIYICRPLRRLRRICEKLHDHTLTFAELVLSCFKRPLHSILRVIVDMLTHINDITRTSPITWAVLSNHVIALIYRWWLVQHIRGNAISIMFTFSAYCQSGFQSADIGLHINVIGRIYWIRIHSSFLVGESSY